MNNKMLFIMLTLFLLLTGCNEKPPIIDEITEYDLPVIEKPDNTQIAHVVNHDGMFRSQQYSAGSKLVIDRNFYDTKEINRGDVVYFTTGAGQENDEYDIARVVGLPGETVTVKEGQIYINDRKLDAFYGKEWHHDYINGTDKAYTMDHSVNIPDGHYFLAGDVWWRSGFKEQVSKDRIKGKVVATTELNMDGLNKALQDAQTLLKIIKEKNAEKLLQLLNKSDFYLPLNIEQANNIIQGFESNFSLDALTIETYDGNRMFPAQGQYEFKLQDDDNNIKEYQEENTLIIRYEENGSAIYHNPYIRYFPYAETMVQKYVGLIREGSVEELASFLNPDDLEVPNWVGEETISQYNDFFNSESMSIRYINHFTFVIENGKGKEHQIEVIYGDGLMSIKDDFIPDF